MFTGMAHFLFSSDFSFVFVAPSVPLSALDEDNAASWG